MRTSVGCYGGTRGRWWTGGDSPPGWAGVDKLLPVWVVGIYFVSSLFVCSSFFHYHPYHQFLYQDFSLPSKTSIPPRILPTSTHTNHPTWHTQTTPSSTFSAPSTRNKPTKSNPLPLPSHKHPAPPKPKSRHKPHQTPSQHSPPSSPSPNSITPTPTTAAAADEEEAAAAAPAASVPP